MASADVVLVDEHTEHDVGIGLAFVLRFGESDMPIGSQSRSNTREQERGFYRYRGS